jgi:hypothetical protein
MTAFPSASLAPEVAQQLLADWDRTHDELRALIVVHEEREWTREEDLQQTRLVRHIAVLSAALHGRHQSDALTPSERAWLEVRIPTQSGQGFRFDVGHRSDLMPAAIPK